MARDVEVRMYSYFNTLRKAVVARDVDAVQQALSNLPRQSYDRKRCDPLTEAVAEPFGNAETVAAARKPMLVVVKLLLEAGFRPDLAVIDYVAKPAVDNTDASGFHSGRRAFDQQVMRLFIAAGADLAKCSSAQLQYLELDNSDLKLAARSALT